MTIYAHRENFIDRALKAAEAFTAPSTGLIHYHYENSDLNYTTIPLYTNALHALALFRSKSVERFKQGRELLTHLLAYEVDGCFPVYLHEYPTARHRNWGVNFLPIFYWVLKEYKKYLNKELVSQLESAVSRILERSEKEEKERPLPKRLRSQILAFKGDIKALDWMPQSSSEWGYYFVASEMLHAEGVDVTEGLEQCRAVWHPAIGTYIGNSTYEKQAFYWEKQGYFHLAMSEWYGKPLAKERSNTLLFLQGALYQGFNPVPETSESETVWFQQKAVDDRILEVKWENYNLACEEFDGNVTQSPIERGVQYAFQLAEKELPFDKDIAEIELYLNLLPNTEVLIEGEKGTVFELEDRVFIETPTKQVSLKFSLENGEGVFLGHLARKNRPSQKSKDPAAPFRAYDHLIYLQSVSRTLQCSLKLEITTKDKAV